MKNAQEKVNDEYTRLCARYADLGFRIDDLEDQRKTVKRQIDALNASVPYVLSAEQDATTQAAAPQFPTAKELNGAKPARAKRTRAKPQQAAASDKKENLS